MTIAAGFVYDDGVLLFADTQVEALAMKTHERKVGSFSCPGGQIGYAMAGNASQATSAMQKCAKRIKKVRPEEVIEKMEEALDDEYRRVVFSHPTYGTDWNLGYWFLISYWSASERRTHLFVTQEHTLKRVDDRRECIGIGRDLAHYLLTLSAHDSMDERRALMLATYVLTKVKDHVPGCGGTSHLLVMRNDGFVYLANPFPFEQVARQSAPYEWSTRHLLVSTVNAELTDSEFEEAIDSVAANARHLRQTWRDSEAQVRTAGAKLHPQLAIGDPPREPPAPE
ncbi:MAG: hypothetical protein WB676_27710 [Bryobacteraceae bacterium]